LFSGSVCNIFNSSQCSGTGACFLWDLGVAGTPNVLHGVSMCEAQKPDATTIFHLIEPGTMEIIHSHTYKEYGVYSVKVFAFNHVSNHTLYTSAVVKDWFCATPNISLPSEIIDESAYFVKMKSEYFVISPNVSVDCMKTAVVEWTWKLYHSDHPQGSPSHVGNSSSSFVHHPRTLEYGRYV
jgi:hypothetical protein